MKASLHPVTLMQGLRISKDRKEEGFADGEVEGRAAAGLSEIAFEGGKLAQSVQGDPS